MNKTILSALVIAIVLISIFSTYYIVKIENSGNTETKNYEYLASFLISHDLVSYVSYNNESLAQLLSTPRIGIESAMAMELAPLLAATKVYAIVNISGYTFYLGVMKGHQVVLVRTGEKEYAMDMATTIMDTFFNIQANILSGTAGSRNPNIIPGDVVIGGYVVDKSSIHYHLAHLGNESESYSETAYTGVEIVNLTPLTNAIIGGFGEAQVTPQNASNYGYGYGVDYSYTYVEAFPASLGLVMLAEKFNTSNWTLPVYNATGLNISGVVKNKIVVGVIGSANQWTEPLFWLEQQNALYETDAGENEGMAFAYVNTHFGVPWIIVRGISDSPWFPHVYIGVIAADRAAQVVEWIVQNFNESLPYLHQTVSFNDLSPLSNAHIYGYIVADRVYYTDLNVTEIVYTAINGSIVKLTNITVMNEEYTYQYGIEMVYKYMETD